MVLHFYQQTGYGVLVNMQLWKLRESFIKGLNNYNTFGKGWLRRLNGIQYGKLIISNGKTI